MVSGTGNKNKEPAAVEAEQKPAAIETVEQLTAAYPQLVKQIKAKVALEIESAGIKSNIRADGFLLGGGDPYATAVARVYARAKGTDCPLPLVLPYNDADSAEALKSYILRAEGACDGKRAAAAKEAMKKVKGQKADK